LDKGGKIELRIRRLGKFEFRLEAKKEKIGKLMDGMEEVLGRVFESKGMWKLNIKEY